METDTGTVAVTVNGEQAVLPAGTTVQQLLEERQLRPEIVAVEMNGVLLRPEEYDGTDLSDGDELDYLFYMAGGCGCLCSPPSAGLRARRWHVPGPTAI